MKRALRSLIAGAFVVLGTLALSVPASAKGPFVVRLDLDGAVQPLSASYVSEGIHRAERDRAEAVLLRIDTPGGLDRSMRKIVGAVLGAEIPVVCWVGPDGARAASAGTFILLACDTATMAPGTNVGAAHPVGFQGEVLDEKVTNDAAAFIRSIAQARGRNAAWAEHAVRDSVSASAREAVRLGVADAVATGPRAALARAGLADRPVVNRSMPLGRGLLGSLVDPNLAFVLLLLGLGGLVIEALHPGLSLPGVLGLFAFVTALVMFEMLPVNVAGFVLVLAGIGFLVLEVHIPGFGLAGAAGIASLVLGGFFLFDQGTFVAVSRPLIVGAAIGKALFILIVVRGVLRARRMAPPTKPTLIGSEGVATTDLDPVGTIRVRSELWTAESPGKRIKAGASVRVVEENGLRLRVTKT